MGVDSLLGMSERFASRPENAERIFAASLQENPASFDATNGLALSLLEQEGQDKLRRALQHAQLLARTNPDTRTQRGRVAGATLAWALFRNGQGAAAQEQMKAVITTGQVSPEIGYFAANIFAEDEANRKLAVDLLSAALKSPIAFPEREEAEQFLNQLLEG